MPGKVGRGEDRVVFPESCRGASKGWGTMPSTEKSGNVSGKFRQGLFWADENGDVEEAFGSAGIGWCFLFREPGQYSGRPFVPGRRKRADGPVLTVPCGTLATITCASRSRRFSSATGKLDITRASAEVRREWSVDRYFPSHTIPISGKASGQGLKDEKKTPWNGGLIMAGEREIRTGARAGPGPGCRTACRPGRRTAPRCRWGRFAVSTRSPRRGFSRDCQAICCIDSPYTGK